MRAGLGLAPLDDEHIAAGGGFEARLEGERRHGPRRWRARALQDAARDHEALAPHEDHVADAESGDAAEVRVGVTREPDPLAQAGDLADRQADVGRARAVVVRDDRAGDTQARIAEERGLARLRSRSDGRDRGDDRRGRLRGRLWCCGAGASVGAGARTTTGRPLGSGSARSAAATGSAEANAVLTTIGAGVSERFGALRTRRRSDAATAGASAASERIRSIAASGRRGSGDRGDRRCAKPPSAGACR